MAQPDLSRPESARARVRSWWDGQTSRRAAARTAAFWIRENWIAVAGLTVLFTLAAGVLYLIWLIVSGIAHVLSAIGQWMSHTAAAAPGFAGDTWHSFTSWEVTRSVTEPVRHYLDQHAAALPASADQVWTAGLITAAVLFVLAWSGSWGARIGWLVLGAATIAAAHAGAPAAGAGLSAGITAVFWGALSVLAFAGTGRRPHITNVTVGARQTSSRTPTT